MNKKGFFQYVAETAFFILFFLFIVVYLIFILFFGSGPGSQRAISSPLEGPSDAALLSYLQTPVTEDVTIADLASALPAAILAKDTAAFTELEHATTAYFEETKSYWHVKIAVEEIKFEPGTLLEHRVGGGNMLTVLDLYSKERITEDRLQTARKTQILQGKKLSQKRVLAPAYLDNPKDQYASIMLLPNAAVLRDYPDARVIVSVAAACAVPYEQTACDPQDQRGVCLAFERLECDGRV